MGGELRGAKVVDNRVSEAEKVGLKTIIVARPRRRKERKANNDDFEGKQEKAMQVIFCGTLYDALIEGLDLQHFGKLNADYK